MTDTDIHARYAPVAEYHSVALLEKAGDIPKVWKGTKYSTDGFIYLFSARPEDLKIALADLSNATSVEMMIHQFPTEVQAKEFIDAFQGEIEAKLGFKYLDFRMIWHFLTKKEFKDDVPTYDWDDATQAFVEIPSVKDGQHRHEGKK